MKVYHCYKYIQQDSYVGQIVRNKDQEVYRYFYLTEGNKYLERLHTGNFQQKAI